MADFTSGMTGAAEVSDSRVIAFNQAFILENEQSQVLDANIVSIQESINAKSFNFPRYGTLAMATTPLTAKEDPASTVLADTEIVLTPEEFGNVVTTTKLANLQSVGKVDVAAAQLVGRNAGRTQDGLCILEMDAAQAGQTIITAASEAALVAGDVVDGAFLEDAYNKLARASIPAIGDQYIMVAHDDVISDIRDDASAAGGWTDVNKYNAQEVVLRNEVGMYKGFRLVRQNDSTIGVDAGASNVDSYRSYFVGFNAVGKAISEPARMTITGPFDKLGRFLNIGWYAALKYLIVEADALVVGISSASRGDNV